MQEVVLVHDEPGIAPIAVDTLQSQGCVVKHVCLCNGPDDLERIKREADAPLVIRTVFERSGRITVT